MKYLKSFESFYDKNLDFSREELTTLVDLGITDIVDGDFHCFGNNLINLEGSPKKVNGKFHCNDNELISLKGAPKEVSGSFYCYNNQLTSLDYLPEYIGGKLYCYNNEWTKPISYDIIKKYKLHSISEDHSDYLWVYTPEQFDRFSSFDYQKEFLENEPENFMELDQFGYADGIEELFPHLFDMNELGLID